MAVESVQVLDSERVGVRPALLKRHLRIFSSLKEVAAPIIGVRRSKHSAAVVYKGKIVSVGFNQLKTHPMMEKFNRNEKAIYLHAEIDAIIRAINLFGPDFLSKCDLYVLRLTREGTVANSKPCSGCQKAIDAFGFRKVYHT